MSAPRQSAPGGPRPFPLSDSARERLRSAVETLAGLLGMGRVRAIVRDVFTRALSESEVRKKVGNPGAASMEIAHALCETGTRGRALAVLARLTTEAWRSPSMDDRVGTMFQRALSALEAADITRYRRELKNLAELAKTMPGEMIEQRELLLAFASQNGERVFHALGQSDEVAAPPEIAPPPPAPAAPPQIPAAAAPAPVLPVSAMAPLPDAPPPLPASPSLFEVVRRLQELGESVEASLAEVAAPGPDLASVSTLWRGDIELATAAVETAAEVVGVYAALEALARAATIAAERVHDAISVADTARAAARQRLAALCGEVSGADALGTLQALIVAIALLPAETTAEGAHAALNQAGPLDQRLVGVERWVKEWRENEEKRRRIEALERELADLRGPSPAPLAPSVPDVVPRQAPAPIALPDPLPPEATAAAEPALLFASATEFPPTFPRGAFLLNIKTGNARVARRVLPLDGEAGVIPQRGAAVERLNAAAGWIIRVCREQVAQGGAPISTYLTILEDVAALIRGAVDGTATLTFLAAATGLIMLPAGDHSPRARRRLADALVRSGSPEVVVGAFVDALGTAAQPALVPVLARLLGLGLRSEVLQLTLAVHANRPSATRGWAEALGIAVAALNPTERDAFFDLALKLAKLDAPATAAVQRWLDAIGPKRPTRPLDIDQPAWLVDALGRLGECEYETSERGEASVNASVPPTVKEAGIYVAPGSEHAVLPVLIRNAGVRGAAAVEVRFASTASSGCTLPAESRDAYVRWIGRDGLEPPHDAIFEVPVDIGADTAPGEFRLNAHVRWAGSTKDSSRDLVYTVVREPPAPARANVPVEGVRGSPLDLNDPKVLARSSRTVRECLAALTAALRDGQSVRAMVYGRRRRGKSSIRRTIANDEAIAKRFVVRENTWNSAPMSSVRFALEHLAGLIREALLDRSEDARPFQPREGATRDELAAAWQAWIQDIGARLKAPARVLLLLDEFQKWLSGLPDKADRLAVLNAFRALNDTSGSRLDVTFVLFGLQNLLRFQKESIDFAAAVKAWQIRPFTVEESKRYVAECIPHAHDDRVRRRLHDLSGGNPFVLNIFCQQLASRANESNRGYCLPSDVEGLLGSLVDDRVEAVFAYMLREDEEENAPSLAQLTALRAVATRLHETGSHDGWVRIEDIEAWLRRKAVPFDTGLPLDHLLQLVDLGILDRHADGRRFGLQGEAICRWLAGQDEQRVPLQPVTLRRDPNLVLNRYRQIKPLAEGAQATTWLAENVEEGGHPVVLKIYRDLGGDVRERVDREGEMLKRVRNPYVITCQSHSVDERKGGVLVLEWVDGQSLWEVLRERPPAAASILPGGQLAAQVELFKKLAAGVAAVHAARVVHKDLKPHNIMLVEASGVFVPKIIDFGVAGDEPDASQGATQSAFTWRYLAPEKRKDPSVRRGRAADVYSLGMVFLDILTGPSQQIEAREILAQLPESTPRKFRQLLEEMTGDEPTARPSAEAILSRLEGVLEAGGWTELVDLATEAFLDDRFEEAAAYYERAVGEAALADRFLPPFGQVVGDLCALLVSNPCAVQWWGALVEAGLDALASGHAPPRLVQDLFDCLRAGVGGSTSGLSRWDSLFDIWERRPAVHGGWMPLLRLVLADATIVRHHGDRLFEIVCRFREASLVDTAEVANFCALAAETTRKTAASTAVVETWLRRGRRVHPMPTDALAAELRAFEDLQHRTQATASLPPNCEHQDRTVVGTDERGHVNVERIERFAHRLLDMHPYVCAVKRKRKDRDVPASAPRLLDDSNIAQHQMDSIEDTRIIPFVLDGSFTAEGVSIRMNILLPKGTSASQRKVARDAIVANGQLFP